MTRGRLVQALLGTKRRAITSGLVLGIALGLSVGAATVSGSSARAPVDEAASADEHAAATVSVPAIAAPLAVNAAAPANEAPVSDPSAPAPVEERTVDVLLARLASNDPFVVLDAADGLAARRATEAIPVLAAMDIAKMPDAAPSVIDSLGKLAGAAEGREREGAAKTLRTWLDQEKHRGAPESVGNVLQIYEALGHTHDGASARALEAELRDPGVSHAAKTVIVASLARLADPASRPVLEEARSAAASATIDDAFEDEIRGDLLTAIDRALGAFPSRGG